MAISINNLQDMLLYDLSSACDAEQVLVKGMEEMQRVATSDRVKQMIQLHIDESQQQVRQLDSIFGILGQKPQKVKCLAAEALVREFADISRQLKQPSLIDLAILACWDKAEHLEISAYHGMIEKAKLVGNNQLVKALQQIVTEEERTAKSVQQLARDLGQQMVGGKTRSVGDFPS